MIDFLKLREANAARQKLWDPGKTKIDLDWRANELAGEVGEVCNILKKIHRERCGLQGSRAGKDQLADELADVAICVDLLALDMGIPAEVLANPSVRERTTPRDEDVVLPRRGLWLTSSLGFLMEEMLWPTHKSNAAAALQNVIRELRSIAQAENIDLWLAVKNKFNFTSRKMRLDVIIE